MDHDYCTSNETVACQPHFSPRLVVSTMIWRIRFVVVLLLVLAVSTVTVDHSPTLPKSYDAVVDHGSNNNNNQLVHHPEPPTYFRRMAPQQQQPQPNRRHRRLNQERVREGDSARGGDAMHATSYAQRHQKYYTGSGSLGGGSSSSSSSASTSAGYRYYNYDDDATKDVHRRYRYYYSDSTFYTDISDVWLCLVTALVWAVWMISSFAASKQTSVGMSTDVMDERFYLQKDSVLLVRGHVREVLRTDNDGGFPTYTAVIDYIIEREQTHESIQIRKHFETQQALEQGFANVELLVLSEEPTHSILKEDFDQQIQEEQRVKELNNRRNNSTSYDDIEKNDPFGDILEGRYCNQKCKRMSTGFAAVLVLASLAGTIQVVCMMDPVVRWQGWISVCFGVALLLPAALLVHKCMVTVTRWQEQPEKQGYIVQSYTTTGTLATSNYHKTLNTNNNDSSTTLMQACMPPSCGGLLDDICDQTVTDNSRANTSKFPYSEAASYVVPEMSGCYFVHYPTNKTNRPKHRPPTHMSEEQSKDLERPFSTIHEVPSNDDGINEVSSTSTVSSISDDDPTENNAPIGIWNSDSST